MTNIEQIERLAHELEQDAAFYLKNAEDIADPLEMIEALRIAIETLHKAEKWTKIAS